jgi:hypothetical protein
VEPAENRKRQTLTTHSGEQNTMQHTLILLTALLLVPLAVFTSPALAEDPPMKQPPIRQHPDNPHYLLFRGKATVLIGSGEHYGALLNRDFDYAKYLPAIQSMGFNLTRTFSGVYCEGVGDFGFKNNTLAPAKDKLICPWARSDQAGYANGGNKFDLTKWDEAYFRRLREFLTEASKRGVVVELVLFCPFYGDSMWNLSPMKASNNVNDVGHMGRNDLPAGSYKAEWVNTKSGETDKETITHAGGRRKIASPAYQEDIALRVVQAKGK